MSKAQELAKCLDLYDDDQTAVHAAAELRRLDAQRAELADCLKECLSAVEIFHGPVAWDIYRDHSPEMKRWRAALSSSGGNGS